MKLSRYGILILLPIVLPLLSGCATTSSTSTASTSVQQQAQNDLSAAWRLHNKAQYHQAITNLLHLMSRFPDTDASIEARYVLGLCYQSVEGYKDALTLYSDYLNVAPDGQYSDDTRRRIQSLSFEYEKKFPSEKNLQRELAGLNQKIESDPDSVVLRMQRADRTWKLGNYESAGRQYLEILDRDPGFANTQLFRERMERQSDGSYIVITPNLLSERDVASQPIVVQNVNSFKTGRDRFSQQRRFYVVSGQVQNRSDETHYGVEVYTTIFGFGNVVWDTGVYNVGRLYPGETRAFSFRFNNIHNINDVNHHETKVTYQK